MFVSLAADETFHRVAIAPLSALTHGAYITSLACERVYFNGARGICLAAEQKDGASSWWAIVFNPQFIPVARIPLTGAPSRVRVSPDGQLAAATVFESGHSYAEHGFSTRTTVLDLSAGASVGDLEQFETFRGGKAVREDDFNFWGVTFAADSDTFYATLDTAGVSYLVRGSVRARRMDIVHRGVECPSLSPDNTRVAFKKRLGARSLGWWQIAILRLDTMQEQPVMTETRSVDDQVEWLGNDRVVYHLTGGSTAADLWSVRVDNSQKPELLLSAAYSPALIGAPDH